MASEDSLTIRLLESCSGSRTSKFLGLIPSGIGYKERSVELDQDVFNLLLALFVDILLIVSHQGLGQGLSDSVYLGGVATTLDANADINISKPKRIKSYNYEEKNICNPYVN